MERIVSRKRSFAKGIWQIVCICSASSRAKPARCMEKPARHGDRPRKPCKSHESKATDHEEHEETRPKSK